MLGKLFKTEKRQCKDSKEIIQEDEDEILFQEKPQICLIDIEDEIKDSLKKKGLNVTEGTLGKAIQVPNKNDLRSRNHKCLLNLSLPPNLHEYEVIVLDLEDKGVIPYNIDQHSKKYIEGCSDIFFYSEYPENLFDPKPYGSYILGSKILENDCKQTILIVFAAANSVKEYQFARSTISGIELERTQKYRNYSFCSKIPNSTNKFGKELIVQDKSKDLKLYDFLSKHTAGSTYHIVFNDPHIYEASEVFVPLIKNSHDETVSFLRIFGNYVLFVFPQIEEKGSFLNELLTNQLPTLFPYIFPFNSEFKWLDEEAYTLPNEKELLEQRKILIEELEEKIGRKDEEIETNHKKYACLHHLLTESGEELVKSVKIFLEWLGFENVRNMDEISEGNLEEDLQVETEEGLLVVEIKGIGGTSKDEECSQIEKIKNRRIKGRKSFDVFGLYIVNHQRHQPPLMRENPPFKEQQINDAENEERGLLTTWQLFNLYFSIKNGCISKEEARKTLLKYGLIEFSPQGCIPLGKPEKLFHNGEVIILDLSLKIETNDELIVKRGDRYLKTKILEIRDHDKKVEYADLGPVGMKVQFAIKKSDELLLKNNNV